MTVRFVAAVVLACGLYCPTSRSLAQTQATTPAARTWTDTATGRTIQAAFVSSDGTRVTLRLNGQDYQTVLSRFSPADQDWVRKQMAAPAATDSGPPAVPALVPPPPATIPSPEPPTLKSLTLGGQSVTPRGRVEFTAPIPEAVIKKAAKLSRGSSEDQDVVLKDALVAVALPAKFDPAKTWPILIVSVTISGKDKGREPSSIKAMNGFVEAAQEGGWLVLAADLPGNISPGLPSNRCALAEAGLAALAQQWPASRTWPVATGGFSGGAKYSGWLGGWFAAEGRKVLGMFMGGCNEDMATLALKEYKPPRKDFLAAKVFLSAGKDDRIAGPAPTEAVRASLKKSGFDQVKSEVFEGAHELHREHVAPALQWFAESMAGK